MEKHTRIKLVAGSAVALALVVALTATVAIAASNVLTADDRGQAVIDDAAAELGVEPSALEEALRQGLKNRVQEAVDAGTLTEERGRGARAADRVRRYSAIRWLRALSRPGR